jgi:hypothetical protein
MNTGNWWWDTEDRRPTGATIEAVICASDKTHLTNVSDDQHAWPPYLTIGKIHKDICWTPKKRSLILAGLILCPPKAVEVIHEAADDAVRTVLSQYSHLEITCPGLKWDCADRLQRQC